MDRKQGNGAKIITTELEKISSIENLVDRKIYFMGLLTREAEKKHLKPIVVGGSAVDFYTEGIYPSYDIDLVSDRESYRGNIGKCIQLQTKWKELDK